MAETREQFNTRFQIRTKMYVLLHHNPNLKQLRARSSKPISSVHELALPLQRGTTASATNCNDIP